MRISCLISALTSALCAYGAETTSVVETGSIELQAAKADVTDVPGLPRVLLIGDSITAGYTARVRQALAGHANIHRCLNNGGSTKHGLASLDAWVGREKWDVIHFNFGLHDLKYVDGQGAMVGPAMGHRLVELPVYEANLRELARRLKKTGAKLVFATTTPVPAGSLGRVEHDELAYNEVARKVMQDFGITINDLHAVTVAHQDTIQLPHNVHFREKGYRELGDAVVGKIALLLRP